MNPKIKKLVFDTGLFALSNIGSKLLVFILVPFYTSMLSTWEYGIVDLITTTNNFLVPVLTLSIGEAVLRFPFDKNSDKGQILANGVGVCLIAVLAVCLLSPLLRIMGEEFKEYWGWLPVLFFSTVSNTLLSNFTRGINKVKTFALKGILQTLLIILFNIIFLLFLRLGLNGYILSIVVADFFAVGFLIIGGRIFCSLEKYSMNKVLMREMLSYSLPLIPTVIAWWIMQLSDKYMVVWFCGASLAGIYSISYKIPSILSTITSIFTQAWQISAFQNSDEADYSEFVSTIYNCFVVLNVIICALLIMLSKILGMILFQKEYFEAWKCVPSLLIAYLFSGLSGVLASVFSASKKTNTLFYSTLIGAVLNVIFNLVLIPKFGIIAAAFTTCTGFMATWVVRIFLTRKFINIKVNWAKDSLAYILLLISAAVMTIDVIYKYWVCCSAVIILFILYFDTIKKLTLLRLKKRKESR